LLQITATGLGFFGRQPMSVLKQGHLGRKVAAFVHFDGFLTGQKANVIAAPVTAGSHQPKMVGHGFYLSL